MPRTVSSWLNDIPTEIILLFSSILRRHLPDPLKKIIHRRVSRERALIRRDDTPLNAVSTERPKSRERERREISVA